jgi:hypothetical protein
MMHYAYLHATPNGDVFYVGKGRKTRWRVDSGGGRSREYKDIVSEHGRESILVAVIPCSSEDAAYELEKGLIKCLRKQGACLVNKSDGGRGCSIGTIFVDGIKLIDAAKRAAVNYDTLHQRIGAGWRLDAAVRTPASSHNNRCYKFYEIDGVSDTLVGHARKYGLKPATVYKRVSAYGWTVREALNLEQRRIV